MIAIETILFKANNVYRGAPFDITVDIHNKGALDVDVVNLRIDGLSRAIYTGVVDDRLRAVDGGLRGKDSSYLGEIKDVTWNTIGIENNLPIRKDMRQEVNIEYCYSGSVEAFPEVCVKPLAGSGGIVEGSCDTGRKTFSDGNGGPIAVTSVEEHTARGTSEGTNRITFTMDVENVGSGDIINSGKVNDCKPTPREKIDNTITIREAKLGDQILSCNDGSKGEDGTILRMYNGKGLLRCTLDSIPNDAHYSLPLYIKLDYAYVDNVKKSFTIKEDIYFT